jgi:hypothetical protein
MTTTTHAKYPLLAHHALDLTVEVTTRLEEIALTIDYIDADGLTDTYDLLVGAANDFMIEITSYLDDEDDCCDDCCDECTTDNSDLTDCVLKILEGHRLGYLSIPEGLVAEMEEALDDDLHPGDQTDEC